MILSSCDHTPVNPTSNRFSPIAQQPPNTTKRTQNETNITSHVNRLNDPFKNSSILQLDQFQSKVSEFKIPTIDEGHSTQVFVVNKSEESDHIQFTKEYVTMLEKTIVELREALEKKNES